MKRLPRITVASGALWMGGLALTEYLLERLGALSTVAWLLPAAWVAKMRSEPYLLFAAIAFFGLAIYLLWAIASDTAKAIKEYRAANDRSWAFEDDFRRFSGAYRSQFERLEIRQQEVETQLKHNTELLEQCIQKLDLLASERDRTLAEIRVSNDEQITEAVRSAVSSAAEEIRNHRVRLQDEAVEQLNAARNDFESQMTTHRNEVEQMIQQITK